MVDTIVLRLHDLAKYDTLIRRLDLDKNKGYRFKTATVDSAEYERIQKMSHISTKSRFDIMELTRTGEYLIKTQVNKRVNVSHHYAFTYRIDITKDYIEFNFSIPKYKFGSNVIMFVEHMQDKDFKFYENSGLEYNISRAPGFLISFIKNFLRREFILDDIDLKDVEINRIDVCYNQIFNSKEEALQYFNYQKKLQKKHSREGDGGKSNYDTSFMYATKRSSSKIYHKGTEYKKHDLKQHLKINEEKGYEYFQTKRMQAFADRILRYELTIRSAELNYLFKHKIFRKDCPLFKIDYKNYMRIGNTIKRNERIAIRIGELPDDEKKEFRLLYPYERISKEDKSTYKYVSQLMERKPQFMIRISKGDEIYNQKTIEGDSNKALFSEELITLCLKKLFAFINEFKVQELPDEERVSILIDEYNSKHKTKLQKADMIQFYKQLAKHGSFKEAGLDSGRSRATWYRYKERFKKIGINQNNVQPDKKDSIPKAPIDFKEYHSFIMHSNILNGINLR